MLASIATIARIFLNKISANGTTPHRSSFVPAMANAGVAPEIRQKLSGHTTEDAHQRYTELEMDQLRKAIESIPSK